jgi:hypothetical protein
MRQRSRFLIAAAVLVAGGLAWRVMRRDRAVPIDFQFDWPAGTELTYSLGYTTKDDVALTGTAQQIAGETDLQGQLVLRSLGLQDGHYLLELSVAPRVHHVTALGRDLLPDDASASAAFDGQRAYLAIRADGVIDSVSTPRGTPELFVNLAQAFAAELEVALPSEARTQGAWQTQVKDLEGEARMQYRGVGAGSIERSRVAYQSLRALPAGVTKATQHVDSHHAIQLAGGHLSSLREIDVLYVAADGHDVISRSVVLELDLVHESHAVAVAPLPAGLERQIPGGIVVSADTARRMLEQRVNGYTEDQLVDDLMLQGGHLGTDNAWMWRAVGLLQLHPEACDRLVTVFSDEALDTHGRQLVLDLLVGAGHGDAQKALRAALESPAATQDHQYIYMLQRVSLLGRPDGDTVAFIAKKLDDAHASGHTDEARASLYSLGAAAGNLAKTNPAAAHAYQQQLDRELDGARTPADRAAALQAIGNAGFPEDTPRVLHETTAEDHTVRAAAASALRNVGTTEATTALLGLAGDTSADVSTEALTALRDRKLDGDQLDQLAAATPQLAPNNDSTLVTIAGDRLEQGEPAVHILQAIADHGLDPDAQARARTLLSRYSTDQ